MSITQPEKAGPDTPRGPRPRIRWYHLYFLLALFDVVVIMFSISLHSKTIEDAAAVTRAASDLDSQLRWLQLAQQRVVELNAPGNELFRAERPEEYEMLSGQMRSAKNNIENLLATGDDHEFNTAELRSEVIKMIAEADGLFEDFRPMSKSTLSKSALESILLLAGPKMAAMDSRQHKALWILGGLVTQHSESKNVLLQQHEAQLQNTAIYQRSFIAAVIIILAGVLIFGRRLYASDRMLDQQRRLLAEERRERLAAIGELCSSVAHGIRNPLAAICSSVELMMDVPNLDTRTSNRLRETLREGERLAERVRGLLDVARMTQVSSDRVNLSELVTYVARELQSEIDKRELKLIHNIPDRPVFAQGDAKNLELAVTELISNAMEHTLPGGTIQLECGSDSSGSEVFVAVEDDGPGIAEGVRDRIFDLFFTTKPRGTGIGLASVKRIARVHGGEVCLSAGDKCGARFEMRLPASQSPSSSPTQSKRRSADELSRCPSPKRLHGV